MTNIRGVYSEHCDWCYHEHSENELWGNTNAKYSLCETGKNQSPIDITPSGITKKEHGNLEFFYQLVTLKERYALNNLLLEIENTEIDHIIFDNTWYNLRQLHFHTPSEHTINGIYYQAEAHFVHKSRDGKLLVVAVLYTFGKANPIFGRIMRSLWDDSDDEKVHLIDLDLSDLLPNSKKYFKYDGSLTMPPCSENIKWIVLANPMTLSEGQIKIFQERVIKFNSRKTKKLNDREIIFCD